MHKDRAAYTVVATLSLLSQVFIARVLELGVPQDHFFPGGMLVGGKVRRESGC